MNFIGLKASEADSLRMFISIFRNEVYDARQETAAAVAKLACLRGKLLSLLKEI
jgi:hypothetical protein